MGFHLGDFMANVLISLIIHFITGTSLKDERSPFLCPCFRRTELSSPPKRMERLTYSSRYDPFQWVC